MTLRIYINFIILHLLCQGISIYHLLFNYIINKEKRLLNSLYLYTLSIIPPPRHRSPSYKTQNCPGVTALAFS